MAFVYEGTTFFSKTTMKSNAYLRFSIAIFLGMFHGNINSSNAIYRFGGFTKTKHIFPQDVWFIIPRNTDI